MAINNILLKINGQTINNIKDYEIEWNKLWKDADRNMNGDVRASLIGIFPKIKIQTSPITKGEAEQLSALLNQPFFTAEFYDPWTDTNISAQYYASDFSVKLLQRQQELFDIVKVDLVPVSKRG